MIERSLKYVWHPCSQMKDYETFKPLEVVGASGSYIHLNNGGKVLDAISSWWCKSLGHQHPRLKQALLVQADKFEHVLLANTTNDVIVSLSEKLAQLSPRLQKVFYASDGSCAVEIALKMSLHSRQVMGEKRHVFISLENGYHGETAGALSVSDLGLYRRPYESMLFETKLIAPLPYVSGADDPLWHDCGLYWQRIEPALASLADVATAVIVEPVLQGAGGMKIYSPDFLRRLRAWTQKHGIHLIADEIMTGLGRTGKMLACQYADIEPDLLCLSKGLTAGWLPLSAVLIDQSLYDVFYQDSDSGHSFLHSHTFTGNPLAASVALAALAVIEEENLCNRANEIGMRMLQNMREIAVSTKKLINIRQVGAMVAADLICDTPKRRLGYEVYQEAVARGVLLRPLGNTIYWLPPLNIEMTDLDKLKDITQAAILSVFLKKP